MAETGRVVGTDTTGVAVNVDPSGFQRQVVSVGDPTAAATAKVNSSGDMVTSLTNPTALLGGIYAGLTSYGMLRVTPEPAGLFNEQFDALDTSVKWATTGSTVAPTATGSNANIVPGAALSAATALTSQPTFGSQGINFLAVGWVAKTENINSTAGTLNYLNSHRFMGIGTVPTTWTAAYTASSSSGPLLNAIGFEIDTDGKTYPVVYANGVRTRPALSLGGTDLATGNGGGSGTPGGLRALADGNYTQFGLAYRGDVIFWYCDSLDLPVASLRWSAANFVTPMASALPLRFHAINGSASAPSGTMAYNIASVGVADTGSNAGQIADGNYPWRKASVSPSGMLSIMSGYGRTFVTANYTSSAPVVADTLLTLSLNKNGTTSSVTTVPVTAGKTLRITNIIVSLRTTSAAVPYGKVTLRVNTSGAAVIGSPAVFYAGVSGQAAVAGNTGTVAIAPEGGIIDLSGANQFGLSFSNNVNTNVADITILGYEY